MEENMQEKRFRSELDPTPFIGQRVALIVTEEAGGFRVSKEKKDEDYFRRRSYVFAAFTRNEEPDERYPEVRIDRDQLMNTGGVRLEQIVVATIQENPKMKGMLLGESVRRLITRPRKLYQQIFEFQSRVLGEVVSYERNSRLYVFRSADGKEEFGFERKHIVTPDEFDQRFLYPLPCKAGYVWLGPKGEQHRKIFPIYEATEKPRLAPIPGESLIAAGNGHAAATSGMLHRPDSGHGPVDRMPQEVFVQR